MKYKIFLTEEFKRDFNKCDKSIRDKIEKEVEKIISASIPQIPKLPELPRLDGLPKIPQKKTLSKLPSYPLSPLGEKFSQNIIKEAVTGKKIGDEGLDPPIHA